jgi:VIT1/CCC1 family predicted Fe2+/Mn2+ transporter
MQLRGSQMQATDTLAAQPPGSPAEPHNDTGAWLRDVILGGQDGLVNVLGIVLGLVAAAASTQIILLAGMAATFAEAVSMGAVAYTSSLAERDHYLSEVARERREIHEIPDEERQEIRELYAAKGFKGDLLEQIVDTICSDEEVWLNVMMAEELQMQPVETRGVLRTSVVVTIACIIGSFVPLTPFWFFDRVPSAIVAIIASAVVLFGVGAYKAKSLVGDWRKSGIQMVAIGLGAAFVGFIVGRIFNTTA